MKSLFKIFIGVFIIILLGSAAFFGYHTYFKKPKEKPIHYHAGFVVYINDQKQDYSNVRFMNIVPCSISKNSAPENPQLEKAHLHDEVGDVVHVENEGAVWGDLFINIHVSFPKGETIQGYATNGSMIANILHSPILPNQSIVIIVGSQLKKDEYLKSAISQSHITEIGQRSESCGIH